MSKYNWAPYVSASGCNSILYTPGAKNLAAYLEDRFPYEFSMGIYNCRPPRGSSSGWSHHAEARAYDCGIAMIDGKADVLRGMAIIDLLGPHGFELGLDHLIFNRKIYSKVAPDGRYYSGVDPHFSHEHIGLSRTAGQRLTYAKLVSVLGDPTTNQGEEDLFTKKLDEAGWRALAKAGLAAGSEAAVVDYWWTKRALRTNDQHQEASDNILAALAVKVASDPSGGGVIDLAARESANHANTRLDNMKNAI